MLTYLLYNCHITDPNPATDPNHTFNYGTVLG
jgi:hypothetical protein